MSFPADAVSLRLDVDLDAVAWNWLFLKNRLRAGADMAAVVKSDAYGLGMAEIARVLHAQGCRHFFVAREEEGIALRAVLDALRAGLAGEESAIYVLQGPQGLDAAGYSRHGLTAVLNSLDDIRRWQAAAEGLGERLPAVIHIDTGMNRLGLNPSDVPVLAALGAVFKALDVRYVMSHLACADDPAHPMNARQLADFKRLAASLGRPLRLSLANSGGVLLGAEYHFDLVRPGCALYGINPDGDPQGPMRNVASLHARILQIRAIDFPGSLGYGAAQAVAPPAVCATVSLGYADGYLRGFTGHGQVFVGGVSCPVAGRVSMDTVIVDITHLKDRPKPGDWAEVMGPHQRADHLARQAGTIGYEILTSLGPRAARLYTEGGKR